MHNTFASAARIISPLHLSLARLPTPVIYLISVVATKAVSLITIPIMAAYLSPADYGDYDVAVSFIEFILLTLGLAIGATLIRFASTAENEEAARQCARELVGTALCIVIVFGIPVIYYGPILLDQLGIRTNHFALRILIAGAAISAMIELPLFWLRLKDRAITFFTVVLARTLAQALLTWFILSQGFGVPGVMISNGLVLLAIAAVLLFMQIRDTGIAVSRSALGHIIFYGLPIVGADLAMFGLGNANKLFMPPYVSSETIAHFGLAARLALIVSLATTPFDLWWIPKRIASLTQPGGLELGARMWGNGIAITILAATAVALGAPIIVHLLLPTSYVGTIAYIGPLVIIQSMHIATLFSNVGSYARKHGSYVFGIEVFSATIAIAGYFLLIPMMGVYGVLVAMAVGQICRFSLHLWFGQELAPLPYPWLAAITCIAVAFILVIIAPPNDWIVWRFLYTFLSLVLVAVTIVASGLVKLSDAWRQRIFSHLGRQW